MFLYNFVPGCSVVEMVSVSELGSRFPWKNVLVLSLKYLKIVFEYISEHCASFETKKC